MSAHELAEKFNSAASHDAAVHQVEAQAVSECWSEGERLRSDVSPFMEELSATAPVLRRERPAPPYVAYLRDAARRVVLSRLRRHPDRLTAGSIDEVVRYAGCVRWLARYEHDGADWQLDRMRRQRFDDDQLTLEETYARFGGYYWTAFRHVDGVIVERERSNGDEEPIVETVERDRNGMVIKLWHGDVVAWERPGTEKTSSEEAVQQLADALAPSIDALRADAPWLIWLRYTGDGPDWTDAAWPKLSAASQDDRSRLSATGWREAWDWTTWNVPEIALAPPDDLARAVDRLDGEADLWAVNALMCSVAERLAATRPDVVLVAVDHELVGIAEMLARLNADDRASLAAVHMDPSAEG